MKNINIKSLIVVGIISALIGCKDQDFEDYKIQSVDNHGNNQNIISTAVTATSNSEFIAYSVDASSSPAVIQLIPVVLTSAEPSSNDIHITMVPALDSLASYNNANGTDYVMPGTQGTPAFTLIDDGVVTIPKGSSVGYLKISTATNDYFGSTSYAFAYKIESVKEPGYTISGNHNFGIAAVIPKNAFDGVYSYGPGSVERYTGCCTQNPPSDVLQGTFTSLPDRGLVTTGLYTLSFVPLWANGGGVGGIDGTYITINPTPQPNGTMSVTMACSTNSSMVNIPGEPNFYDPTTKTFQLAFQWGAVNKRTIRTTLKYSGPR